MRRGQYIGKPVLRPGEPEPKVSDHFIQCEVCGGMIDMRDLVQVIEHGGPLPHPSIDKVQ